MVRYVKIKMIVIFYENTNAFSHEPCLDTSLRWYDGLLGGLAIELACALFNIKRE